MNFRPKIILFNDPLIHLTFESLIHILFRHTWDFRINENYGKKDVIPYKLQELEGLMTNVISELKSEIQHHYKTHPGKRFGKFKEEKYYYEGNYYHIHISPNGLIETFYCVNP